MADEKDERSPLEQVEARREARKAANRKAAEDQLAKDLEAIDALEAAQGDDEIAVVRVKAPAGMPAAVACRCPKPSELKRFRDRVKPQKDARNREVEPDHAKACEELAAVCLLYPDREAYDALCAARPGLAAQLGKEAVKLAVGAEESEGK